MDTTNLVLEMMQSGITQEKAWMLTQLILAGFIVAGIVRGAQLALAGAELWANSRLKPGSWVNETTPIGDPVRLKVLKRGLFRIWLLNYETSNLQSRSNITYVKQNKEYQVTNPVGIDPSKDYTSEVFGL